MKERVEQILAEREAASLADKNEERKKLIETENKKREMEQKATKFLIPLLQQANKQLLENRGEISVNAEVGEGFARLQWLSKYAQKASKENVRSSGVRSAILRWLPKYAVETQKQGVKRRAGDYIGVTLKINSNEECYFENKVFDQRTGMPVPVFNSIGMAGSNELLANFEDKMVIWFANQIDR